MEKVKDLLELLYTARDRFSSIQATFQYRYRLDLMDEAYRRWAAQQAPGSVSSQFYSAPSWWLKFLRWSLRFPWGPQFLRWSQQCFQRGHKTQESKASGEVLCLWRVWLQKPSRWRFEQEFEHEVGRHVSISIIDGDRWWSWWSPDPTSGELYTNVVPQQGRYRKSKIPSSDNRTSIEHKINEVPSLDPSFLLAGYDLQLVGSTVHAGREVIQVKAVPRKGKEGVQESFWIEADEFELLVDKERGILLHYSAKLDGYEYAVVSAESIAFDEPIPEGIFSFTPAPNTLYVVVEE